MNNALLILFPKYSLPKRYNNNYQIFGFSKIAKHHLADKFPRFIIQKLIHNIVETLFIQNPM